MGPTATQAGSYNKPGYLRFDYSATQGMSEALRLEIEQRANQAIRDAFDVTASQMPLEDAKALGAMAMFGEKYPPVVRMVELAGPWSRELCGGTHVANTAQIGVLNLLSESSIGSGVRRVEALVAQDAGTGAAVVALFGGSGGKAAGVVATNAAARELGVRAGQLISVACQAMGGKGGGKDDLAQGGGSDPDAAPKAIAAVEEALAGRG